MLPWIGGIVDNQKNYRRFKGDGSVYQRQSDGRWVGKYKDEYMPRAKYVYAQTENEARKN